MWRRLFSLCWQINPPWLREHRHLNVYAFASTDIVPTPGQYLDKSKPTLFVSYARSGNSLESVAAIKLADQCLTECHHLILTCNLQSTLTDYAKTEQMSVYSLCLKDQTIVALQ